MYDEYPDEDDGDGIAGCFSCLMLAGIVILTIGLTVYVLVLTF